jgi:hypothetical protein
MCFHLFGLVHLHGLNLKRNVFCVCVFIRFEVPVYFAPPLPSSMDPAAGLVC